MSLTLPLPTALPRGIAGRYLGADDAHLVQLRVDVGEEGSLGMISGDLYRRQGGASPVGEVFDPDAEDGWRYLGSFVSQLISQRWVHGRALELSAPLSFQSRADLYGQLALKIYVPLVGRPETSAEIEVLIASHRKADEAFVVRAQVHRRATALRDVRLRVDRAADPQTGQPYATPAPFTVGTASPFPDDMAGQEVTVHSAFAQAGVSLHITEGDKAIVLPERAHKHGLGDDELHAILAAASKDEPNEGWWMHLLIAPRYCWRGVLGIMYDSERANPRHGVVVFYDELRRVAPEGSPEFAREFVFTTVHEIGHAFNLLHSFQKGYFGGSDMTPRPASPSWMNYPHYYPHGRMVKFDQADDFWRDFRFTFDREELEHLRHHERGEVLMGGDCFGSIGDLITPVSLGGAGPLAVRLEAPALVDFGEPFTVALVLTNRSAQPITVGLPPDTLDALEVVIARPNGAVQRFEPLLHRRVIEVIEHELAPGETRRIPVSLFYGKHGFTFPDPGTYRLAAVVHPANLPAIRTTTLPLCVGAPSRELEKPLIDMVYGDEQGHFLTFYGGDHLRQGKQALEAMVVDPRLRASRAATRVRGVLAASYARSYQGFALADAGRTAAPVVRAPRLDLAAPLVGIAPPLRVARPAAQKTPVGQVPGPPAPVGPGGMLRALVEALRMQDVPESVLARIEEPT
jgi:hypothetical protein